MPENEMIVITMTRKELDDYVDKYHKKPQLPSVSENGEKISQRAAAALFGVTTATIIRWQKKGIIPFNKVGGTVFYYKALLLEVAQKNPSLLK